FWFAKAMILAIVGPLPLVVRRLGRGSRRASPTASSFRATLAESFFRTKCEHFVLVSALAAWGFALGQGTVSARRSRAFVDSLVGENRISLAGRRISEGACETADALALFRQLRSVKKPFAVSVAPPPRSDVQVTRPCFCRPGAVSKRTNVPVGSVM